MYKKYLFNLVFIFIIVFLFIGLNLIPTTGKIIRVIQPNSITYTDIDGIYYLRDDDPLNYLDEGSLLRIMPIEEEVTLCGLFILFHFAEKGEYSENVKINNIYYHLWQKTPESPLEGELFDIGYSTSGGHNTDMNETIQINTSENIVEVNKYRLVQAMQFINPDIAFFNSDEIFNFTIKSIGNAPNIRSFPDQYSFVILNLEDNSTLETYDRDDDELNDFDELFKYYTNPFDCDTDNDGISDYFEFLAGTDPNDNTDYPLSNTPPNTPTIFGPNRGKPGISYEFSFYSIDPEGDNVRYLIDWGDSSADNTIFSLSGTEMTISHTWSERGTYTIKAKARDVYGAESGCGELTVKIPKLRTIDFPFLKFLEDHPYIFTLLKFFLQKLDFNN